MSFFAIRSIGSPIFIPSHVRAIHNRCRIGNRDWVGFGKNGSANYQDNPMFPFPAVRFKENTRDICLVVLVLDLRKLFAIELTDPKWILASDRRPRQSLLLNCISENIASIIAEALREKERGDWKMLCCEEKKALYRASFCQTYSEFNHCTGSWKLVLGGVLICVTYGFWTMIFYHYYVYETLPASLSKKSQKAQLRRMIELRVNPIDGLTSHWDYDNDRWK